MPITVPSPTRVRVLFDSPIEAGAVDTSLYVVTSVDSLGADPVISYAFTVEGTPNGVELVLADPLADGGQYEIAWSAVPLADGIVAGSELFRTGQATDRREDAPLVEPIEPLLYGNDLAWRGDFLTGPDGDLATTTGVPLVGEAARRRQVSQGLAWNPAYSPHLRQYVDAPEGAAVSVRTAVLSDLLRDDRIARATVSLPNVVDGNAVFEATIWPRANPESPQTFNVSVPVS